MNVKYFVLVFVIAVTLTVSFIAAYRCGHKDGVNHVIEESRISVVGSDILIDLDGEVYVHSAE